MNGPFPSIPPQVEPPGPVLSEPRTLGGLRELILFGLAAFALTLLVPMAVLLLVVTLFANPESGAPTRATFEQFASDPYFLFPTQVLLYIFLLGLLFVMVRVVRGMGFREGLQLKPVTTGGLTGMLSMGFVLALALSLVDRFFPAPEPLPIEDLFQTRTSALLVLGTAVLAAPWIEELVFRGYIYTILERLWGRGAAIILSGFFFGAIHFPQLWPGYAQMLMLCIAGWAFSAARAWTGNTTAAMFMHFGYNLLIAVGTLASPQFQELATAVISFP